MWTVYWEESLVAMFSVLNMPSGTNKYCFRVHRMVVLPDYQGLGIGTILLDWFGEYFLSKGFKLFIRSSHIRLANHCRSCNKYKENNTSGKIRKSNSAYGTQLEKYHNLDFKRAAYSFEYVGRDYLTKPKQIIVADSVTQINEANEYLNKIINKNFYPIIVTNIADQSFENSFEKIAHKNGIRTEVLWIKKNNKFVLNNKRLNEKFDAIVLDENTKKAIEPYKRNINNIITYWKNDKNTLYVRIK